MKLLMCEKFILFDNIVVYIINENDILKQNHSNCKQFIESTTKITDNVFK